MYKQNGESGMDSGVRMWAEKCTSIRVKYNTILQKVNTEESENDMESQNMGWALKCTAKNARFSVKVKTYLLDIFVQCDKSGKRPNYGMLSEELKKVCDENGNRMFCPDEWLIPSQIRGVFASYLMKQRKVNYQKSEKSTYEQ